MVHSPSAHVWVRQGHSPHLWLFLALLHLGRTRGKDSIGCSQPGCAVVEGAELALLCSAPLLWLGLARRCRIPPVGADPLLQILMSSRERDLASGSCIGLTPCFVVCQRNHLPRSDD